MGCQSSKARPQLFEEASTLSLRDDKEEEEEEEKEEEKGTQKDPAEKQREEHYQLLLSRTLDLDKVNFGAAPTIEAPVVLFFSEAALDRMETEQIVLRNEEEVPVFFKLKITNPKHFVFKPNQGRIAPESSLTVDVTFKPNVTESREEAKAMLKKTKVLVQGLTLPHPPKDDRLPYELWTKATKSNLSRTFIKLDIREAEDEELDLTKFMSVSNETYGDSKWWKS